MNLWTPVRLCVADASRARVLEFLQRHTAYELIPESNKVVVLDTNLPARLHNHYASQHQSRPLYHQLNSSRRLSSQTDEKGGVKVHSQLELEQLVE